MLKYLHSGQASVGQQNWAVGIPLRKRTAGGTPSHHHYLVTLLWQVLISQMLIHLDVQMNRYFSKVVWPNCDNITSSWGEVSPRLLSQELSYPSLVTTNPLEVKIISILLYKNNNSPTLFCTFTIDNSSFLTTIKKKMSCVSLFSIKKFLIYKFKVLSLLKWLYSMSSATYIHGPLPVTLWCHSVTDLI